MSEIIEKAMTSESAKKQQEFYIKQQANKPNKNNFKKKKR